jgi:hypothetical protein
MPDRLWEQYRNTSKTKQKKFVDDLRGYLLETYHCNFTMFIEDICPQSYADEDVWSSLAESGDSPIEFADNMFSDYDQEHRQRFLNVLSSGMTNS